MDTLKNLIKSYEAWVASNPQTVCDLETTTKWVSYFIAGRISNSNIVSELVYSLSNIMVLYHDRVIERARHCANYAISDAPGTSQQFRAQFYGGGGGAGGGGDNNDESEDSLCNRLKVMLTTLEYCEVFIEISAKRAFGKRGKWFLIVVMQVLKAAGRFFILKHSTGQIITSPAMPSLNRRALIKSQQQNKNANGIGIIAQDNASQAALNNASNPEHTITFQLKRSGRVIRKVEGAPPIQYRDFNLINEYNGNGNVLGKCAVPNMPLPLLQAEYLYIAKPLIHLATIGAFGDRRWKQYFVALALDFASIRLYHKNRHLMSKQQRLEMSRRCINLLLYLMKSPLYESFTQSRVERIMNFVADNVPLLKLIAGPLRDYLPHWQSTYFYLWST